MADFLHDRDLPGLRVGPDVLALKGNLAIVGAVARLRRMGAEIVPALFAGASPSGRVEDSVFEIVAAEIVSIAEEVGPDAIYLDLHGAMATESHDDGEGELLARLRQQVGSVTPIVASLDLHANVTERMLREADGLVACRRYPHTDLRETGGRAVALLSRIVRGASRQVASSPVPFLIPTYGGSTELEPARSVYAEVGRLGDADRFVSFAMGFPAADFNGCGPMVWSNASDLGSARGAVDDILDGVVAREPDWALPMFSPQEAITRAETHLLHSSGPVVIADCQDNPGAGGSSQTTGMIRALQAARVAAAVGAILDPEAASAAHGVGVGGLVEVGVGGDVEVTGDEPAKGGFIVEALSDGRATLTGLMAGGAEVDLGPAACLRQGDLKVVVTSRKCQMWDRDLFRMVGVEPEAERILVVKSGVHFRADFAPIASLILVAKSPGRMLADPADFAWTNLRVGMRVGPGGRPFSAVDEQHPRERP